MRRPKRTETNGHPRGRALARWRTDRRLDITHSTHLDSTPLRSLPEVGQSIAAGGRGTGLLDLDAHRQALRGRSVRYELRILHRTYEVSVTPWLDRRRKIVGTRGTLRLLGEDSAAPARSLRKKPGVRAGSLESTLQVLDLAKTVAQTARIRMEARVRVLEARQKEAEVALLAMREEERRGRVLVESIAILDDTGRDPRPLDRLGDLLIRQFCDVFVLYLADDGKLGRKALAARNEIPAALLEEAFPPLIDPPSIVEARVSGSEIFNGLSSADRRRFVPAETSPDAIGRLGVHSALRTTLKARGRVVGQGYFLLTEPGEPYKLGDLRMVENLAARIALAEESARLYADAQREIVRRKEAEQKLLTFNAELERIVAQRTRLLEESNREANNFAYTVAHDLRAPLRAMTGFCQALREDYAEKIDAVGKDYLERIIAGSFRMDALIRDLLDYARLSRTELATETVEMDAVLDAALDQLHDELRQRGAKVGREPLGKVVGHGPMLTQVLANLIANAVKFVAPGTLPQVRIRSVQRDGRHRIYVEDNGIGIAPEYQDRIFGIFERLNLTEVYPGTGIGLAIVRRALERLGGSSGVESQAGAGSRFWIELPAAL